MTEEEAKRKWCPFVKVFVRDDELWSNRPDNGFTSDSYCVGAECMAWRLWPTEMEVTDAQGKIVKREGRLYSRGYCGLAGKP